MQISTSLLFFLSRKYPKWLRQKKVLSNTPGLHGALVWRVTFRLWAPQPKEKSAQWVIMPLFFGFCISSPSLLGKKNPTFSRVRSAKLSGALRFLGRVPLERGAEGSWGREGSGCAFRGGSGSEQQTLRALHPAHKARLPNCKAIVLNPNDVTCPRSPKPLFITLICTVRLPPITCWVL